VISGLTPPSMEKFSANKLSEKESQEPPSRSLGSEQVSHEDIQGHIKSFATEAGLTLGGKLTGRGIHVLGQVVLARWLGPENFGLYALGWTFLRIVAFFAPLGMDKGVVHFASKYYRDDESSLKGVIFLALGLAFLTGLIAGIFFFVIAPWLANQVFQKPAFESVIRLLAFTFPIVTTWTVAAWTTTVGQRMKYYVLAFDLVQPVGNFLLIVLAYMLGWGLQGAVGAVVVSFLCAFILALYFVIKRFPQLLSQSIKPRFYLGPMLAFSIPASFALIFSLLILWIDKLLVGYFLPSAEMGIYHAAAQLSIIVAIILAGLGATMTPSIADNIGKGKHARLEELAKVSTKWGLYLSTPLALLLMIIPTEMLEVFFGSEYVRGDSLVVLLVAAQLINVSRGSIGIILIMTGHQNRWLAISGSILLIHIVLCLFLIPALGSYGAAISTLVAMIGLLVLGAWQVWRVHKFIVYDYRVGKVFLSAAIAAAALILLRRGTDFSPLITVIASMIVCFFVYGGSLFALGLDEEDRQVIRRIRYNIFSA